MSLRLLLKIQRLIRKSQLSFPFLLLILLVSYDANSQTREELEQQRFEIIQKIDDTNELLKLTAKNKTVLLSDLVIIESQIENRKVLLSQIEQEIQLIDSDILSRAFQKEAKQQRVDSLRAQYNVVLRAVYRERALHNPILALLSSQSVSQSLLKANVYSRLRDYVGQKLNSLRNEQYDLEMQMADLKQDKDNKREVLRQVAEQSALLENEQDRQQVMISSLQEDESTLKFDLNVQSKNREQMNIEIEGILKSEFAEELAATSSGSNSFDVLKGKMTWPVQGGVISSKYGKQPHPTMRNLTISNNGVDMRAPLAADVSAVFGGSVVSVSKMSGFGVTVIVDHGIYFTVYSRLANTNLNKGDKIQVGASIGKLEVKDDSSELHFEIWKDNKTQNPAEWLGK